MSNNKSYRIKFNEGEDHADINLNINQDIDIFEVLSLKIKTKNFYKLQASNYGCVAGRVLANNGIGVPNVKLSIFIAADEETKSDSVLSSLYPYENVFDKNESGIRYNLLTEEQLTGCFQPVGTFPSKRMVLDDSNVFEIFDKYYKFTTTTNFAGDYMIFGVPTGSQILHMDVDLSDIGPILSQTPSDFIYKGYDANLFESPVQFKKSTDLDSLPQIFSQNENVQVYPFWGDPSEMKENNSTGVRISRKDINLNYKFEPTCVFFGSLVSDEKSNGVSEKCVPTDRMGKMDKLTTGEGTIEMIRKTPSGDVESYNIAGTHLIDGDGTWCYQIPMNLDYIKTDENGNIVPSDDPNKGLPTRTSVRFRFSLNDFASDYEHNHLCKMLVPNNPFSEDEVDNMYVFGTLTPDSEFRDLLWNKVYSVKSYIPRIQKSDFNREKRFSGFKAVNVNASNNPLPYNNLRVDITFMFVLQCAIIHTLIWITGVFNSLMKYVTFIAEKSVGSYKTDFSIFRCLSVGDGACPDLDGWYFAPNCDNASDGLLKKTNLLGNTMLYINKKINGNDEDETFSYDGTNVTIEKPQVVDKQSIDQENSGYNESTGQGEGVCVATKIDYFIKCVELALAQEYEVIQFDFYNDWMNGMLYIPRWFANVKKKRSYLFGLIKTPERVIGCMEDSFNIRRRYVQQCALTYDVYIPKESETEATDVKIINSFGCYPLYSNVKRCHKARGRKRIKIFKKDNWTPGGGIVHSEETTKQQHVYYFRPRDFRINRDVSRNPKFVTLFATDIILLGSMSENDIDGVPKVSELISSSYKMPTNLAATNMDITGPMFGAKTSNITTGYNNASFKCNEFSIPTFQYEALDGTHNIRVIHAMLDKKDDTFKNYEEWAQYEKTDGGIDTSNDEDEYPLTEASGIDWGYTGPEQYDLKLNNKDNKYFLPGGHFLGLSCFNSETTIISCVNLSRICEIGVNMSRRKTVEKLNEDQIDMYVVPTGFISDYDIYDGDFRSVFATLNHNGLATKYDKVSGRHVYDIIPIYLTGFEGSMRKNGERNLQIDLDKPYTPEGVQNVSRRIFAKNPEKFDINYYYYRLGLKNKNNLTLFDVYLDHEIDEEYHSSTNYILSSKLPLYNNSFYFYFGLHDGATALDKFHEKFYGECEIQQTAAVQKIDIAVKDVTGAVCNKNGKVIITVNGISEGVVATIYDSNDVEVASMATEGNVIEVRGLGIGSYYALVLISGNSHKFTFTVKFYGTNQIVYEKANFKPGVTREETFATETYSEVRYDGGYIFFEVDGSISNPPTFEDKHVSKIVVKADPAYSDNQEYFEVPSNFLGLNQFYVACKKPGHYLSVVTCKCDDAEYDIIEVFNLIVKNA